MPSQMASQISPIVAFIGGKRVKAVLTLVSGRIQFRFDDGSYSREYKPNEKVEYTYE